MPPDLTGPRAPRWQDDLLAWSERTRRDLPWRKTRDPWAILVSELMLQQTQVPRVIPKFQAFLARFPDPPTCAAAPVADVVVAWAGLGYNRRAVHLHAAATGITQEHGGRVPDQLEALLALPGVGPYTARAVLAFAFEREVGVLDTNAARVLARRAGHRLTGRGAQRAADEAVPAGAGWAWNQAVLDLGATVCVARSPRCGECPVRRGCVWESSGRPEPDPAVGSAGVSGAQSRFEGSDRQGRGRLVDALRQGPVDQAHLAVVMGWPDDEDRANRVAATLVADRIVRQSGGRWTLRGRSVP